MSIQLKFDENVIREYDEEQNKDLITFKHWLGMQSCIGYMNGLGYIDKEHHMTEVDIMCNKTIKLLIGNIEGNTFLVTQDGEKYLWRDTSVKAIFDYGETESDDGIEYEITFYNSNKIDWSNTKIVKATTNTDDFLALTDEGKVYYTNVWRNGIDCGIYQMDIKEKIICMGCGINFYVLVTDNCKTYTWYRNVGTKTFIDEPHEIAEFTGKTIVKVACGPDYTLALTDKGKVYSWGSNVSEQLNPNNTHDVSSPIMINIANVKKVSDIAVIDVKSFVKSSEDGLVYCTFDSMVSSKKPVVCEYTNAFDISNSMMGQSPISMTRQFINEEFHILNDLETAFNDKSTSDLTMIVEKQSIYVHKVILKIRSTYFRTMFQTDWIENKQSIIENHNYKYIVYKKFLEYLYTGKINLSSFENLLGEFEINILADEFCEENLQTDCTRKIKKTINVSNVMRLFKIINEMTVEHYKKELMKYCFNFYFKNMTNVIRTESFKELDVETKSMLIHKGKNFFLSEIGSCGYLE
ncbi:RCC1 and BTB domain-containing protein 1 [Mycetomoellerius zeteki]|uniref:RCC1 and BTB domain-containing protein 1 n=1 Tax=Mycetomoellerius zeteki TaxID=64791 RepID=UPI00084E4853|nr:PREDICTED: RCC1 and BTB domain-containing protein 1-like [Trachymyrmex zeteki]